MIKYALYIVFVAALVVDYYQTKKILRSKDWTELNRVIVWFYKKAHIIAWFVAWAVVPVAVIYFIPNEYAVALAGFLAGTQTNTVWRNWRIGI